MLQIALCDDEPEELRKTESLVLSYRQEHPEQEMTVRRFTSMQSLLEELQRCDDCDLLLLDVCLPGKSGIDAARELRAGGCAVPIVFLTASRDYAVEAFEVEAAQYLLKPISKQELFKALETVLEQKASEKLSYLLFKSEGELRRVAPQEIIYSEAQGNYQCLSLTGGRQWRVRMTTAELLERLLGHAGFARCGTPYLINLLHVAALSTKQLRLDTGKTLWIPRGAYPQLKQQYFEFYCGGEDEL